MSEAFFVSILVGFVAQLIKGSIGMAFGVICSAFLLTLGLPPTVISTSVHTASIATTATSGITHCLFKNVDYALFRRLIVPGVISSILGAYSLTKIPLNIARPIIAAYLLIMGFIILYKFLGQVYTNKKSTTGLIGNITLTELPSQHVKGVTPLATLGGFLDAIGGGGWGHIITSSLLAQSATPRYVIGTVNSVQFFVAISACATFFITNGISHWSIIIGLMIGGVSAAPLGALMIKRINSRVIMLIASIIIISLSTHTLAKNMSHFNGITQLLQIFTPPTENKIGNKHQL